MDLKGFIRGIDQVGLVVRDLETTLNLYISLLGIGPWQLYTFQPPLVTEMRVRERPTLYRMKIALTMLGSVMLELIEPLEGENIYQPFLDDRGPGVHHIGCYVDDIAKGIEAAKAAGIGVLQSGKLLDGGYAYLDTEDKLGIIVELIQMPSQMPPAEAVRP